MATQQTGTAIEVPAAEHGPGFPPFDEQTFPSQLLWLVLTFVALYLLMSRVALPRVGSILEARSQRVASDLAEAGRHRDESEAAKAAYEQALAEARGRALTLAAQARQKQVAEANASRDALEQRLNARIAESERAIAGAKEAALRNIRDMASGAAADIVARLTGRAPSEKATADAVADVLKR